MSDMEKLMGKLDAVETKLNDFEKSRTAAEEAVRKGDDALKAEIAAMRKQNQEIAELTRRGVPSAETSGARALGEAVVKSFRGGRDKAASEGTDAGGGYTVNDELTTRIISVQEKYGAVRQLFGASIYPMASDVTKVPVDTFEDTSGNTPEPAATSENAQISASTDAVLSQVTLTAQKYATLNYVSSELVDDSFVVFIGAYLMPKLGRRAAKIEDGVVFTTASTGLVNTANVQVVNMDAGETGFPDLFTKDGVDLPLASNVV